MVYEENFRIISAMTHIAQTLCFNLHKNLLFYFHVEASSYACLSISKYDLAEYVYLKSR